MKVFGGAAREWARRERRDGPEDARRHSVGPPAASGRGAQAVDQPRVGPAAGQRPARRRPIAQGAGFTQLWVRLHFASPLLPLRCSPGTARSAWTATAARRSPSTNPPLLHARLARTWFSGPPIARRGGIGPSVGPGRPGTADVGRLFRSAIEVPEDGDTFATNAAQKASPEQARHLGRWILADDSGLAVDALGGGPAVRPAPHCRPGATDQANNEKLLAELGGCAA